MFSRLRNILLAVAAIFGLLFGTIATAQAAPTPIHTTRYRMLHFACSIGGYTYAVDQHWKIETFSEGYDNMYSLLYEDEGTSPAFKANRVNLTNYNDGSLYSHGGSSSTLNDVPSSISHATPNLNGTSLNYYFSPAGGAWNGSHSPYAGQMVAQGVGAGDATVQCNDPTPTATTE